MPLYIKKQDMHPNRKRQRNELVIKIIYSPQKTPIKRCLVSLTFSNQNLNLISYFSNNLLLSIVKNVGRKMKHLHNVTGGNFKCCLLLVEQLGNIFLPF